MHKLYCEENLLSHAQKYLLELCDHRKLADFYKNNIPQDKFSFAYAFYVATGKHSIPSIEFIFALKNIICPADWYYLVTENKPDYSGLEYCNEIKESINYKKLIEMYENKTLWNFCKDNNIGYSSLYHSISGRNTISSFQILQLKAFFEPINWFTKK